MAELRAETDYFHLYEMAAGVFAAVAKPGTGAWSNAGVVDLGEELLVFDSFSTPSAAQELRNQAEKLTGKKVKHLINSHYHGDHVFGNQVFEDAAIVSTSLTRQLFEEQNVLKEIAVEQAEMAHYLLSLEHQIKAAENPVIRASLINQSEEMARVKEELPHLKMVLPTVAFEDSRIFQGSKRTVELHCLGGAHTPSDSFLYLPEEKILFAGDIVTEALHLPIYDPDGFLKTLEALKTFEIDAVLPGHGAIHSVKIIEAMHDYLLLLSDSAKQAHDEKVALEEYVAEFLLPEAYAKWRGTNGIQRNLKTVYNFYEAKEKE